MKIRYLFYLLLASLVFASCVQKNDVSKIPQISLMFFGKYPSGVDSLNFNNDSAALQFSLTDGDADIGNDPNGNKNDIFVKDFRYDTGFVGYHFPAIDLTIEDPKKGIQGVCTFLFTPVMFTASARNDSVHSKYGDTTHYEIYIVDRAGNESNHITTGSLILRP